MLEASYLSQYRLLQLNSTIALYLVYMYLSMQGSNTLPLPQPTPVRRHSASHTAEQHDGINEYLSRHRAQDSIHVYSGFTPT